jgi:hypothetical protein
LPLYEKKITGKFNTPRSRNVQQKTKQWQGNRASEGVQVERSNEKRSKVRDKQLFSRMRRDENRKTTRCTHISFPVVYERNKNGRKQTGKEKKKKQQAIPSQRSPMISDISGKKKRKTKDAKAQKRRSKVLMKCGKRRSNETTPENITESLPILYHNRQTAHSMHHVG